MKVRILGTAAGGGVPQWNCACASCAWVRTHDAQRTQDSLAITGNGSAWYLVNASPDVRHQLLAAPELAPGPGLRQTPLHGVLLTSGELDHTLGLLALREADQLTVHSTVCVHDALTTTLSMGDALGRYTNLSWRVFACDEPIALEGGLTATAFALGSKRPRYVDAPDAEDWVIGYRFTDNATGRVLVYAPCLASWTESLDAAIHEADVVLLDGTFYNEQEMVDRAGLSRAARTMGHLPIRDSLPLFSRRTTGRYVYTHLNNTNPLVRPDSPQHKDLGQARAEVAADGQVIDF